MVVDAVDIPGVIEPACAKASPHGHTEPVGEELGHLQLGKVTFSFLRVAHVALNFIWTGLFASRPG